MPKEKSEIEVRKETAPISTEGWPTLLSLRQDINRLFDDFGTGFWRQPLSRRMSARLPTEKKWNLRPATELVECDGEYRIAAELPSLTADHIDVKLRDGTIKIRGEQSEEMKDYMISERRYGEFQRTLTLPAGIDADAISADFANGVLTVTLPKTAEAKQKERKVEIKTAA